MLSAIVLLLIIMPILLSLLLNIPAVQNFVVHKATEVVSHKLETTVSIGHVDIGLFNKLHVDRVYVEDYQKDTLLYAEHVEAYITGFGFGGRGIVLARAKLSGARLCLHETPSGDLNIKQIIDRLSKKDAPKTGNFKLTIKSAVIDGMEFCLERYEHMDRPFGIDFKHLHVYDIRGRVKELTIDGSAISADIGSLAARERSGFRLDELAGRFYLNDGCLGFEELAIRTQYSRLDIPSVSLVGDSWTGYKDFLGDVQIAASIRRSTLATDDVAYFAPALRDWHTIFTDIDLTAEGTVDDFTTSVSGLGAGVGTRIAVQATVKGLPDIRRTHFDLRIGEIATTGHDIEHFASAIAHKKLTGKLPVMLGKAGRMAMQGTFVGTFSAFRMQASLATQVGKTTVNLHIKPLRRGGRSIQGGVSVKDVLLGELLGNSRIGGVSLTAGIDGVVSRTYADIKVGAEVAKFQFNGYEYDSVRLDGNVTNKRFDGHITARDPNLDFDFAGMVDLNDSVPHYDFSLDLRRADLAKMHINPRDSVSVLAARVVARAAGRTLDDLNGDIRISDASYHYNDKQIEAQRVIVIGENTPRSKFVQLSSDFADVTFRSKTSYKEVLEYLKMSAWKYLPIIYDKDKYVSRAVQETSAADDYSLLSVQVKQINPLIDAVSAGLQVADGSQMQLLFNPASDKLSFKASSEYIEKGERMLVTKINVNASNHGDSLAFYAASEDFYMGMFHLRNLSVTGGAREGRLQFTTGFRDSVRHMSGLLGIAASLTPTPGPHGRALDIRILPSHITRADKTWQIFARRIELDTAQVVINNFYIMNAQQDLLINGVASRSRADSVTVRLRNFDLAPFTQIVDRMGYVLEGVTNGAATIKSALQGSEITADIRMDSVRVNSIPVPPLLLTSKWDFQRNRAGFLVENRVRRDTLVQGFYAPSQMRYYARLKADSLDLRLIDPILRGVISETRGYADADLTLTGQQRDAELRGTVRATGLQTKVDFTQVVYTVPSVVLDVKNNHFRARDVEINDSEGNSGGLDFDLSLEHLSNIAYTLRVTPREMLVLNTTIQDNDLFYGRVYATGAATIAGDKRGVTMDVNATTERRSNFNLSLTGKSNLSVANFVTFQSGTRVDTTDYLAQRKLLFERRRTDKKNTESAMNINLALNVRPTLDFTMEPIEGSIINGRGEGMLNLVINPRQSLFEMYGDYTIAEGTYSLSLENLITRKFIIENGSSILWTGSPMNALLNISAVYKLKASLTPLFAGTSNAVGGDRSVPVECMIQLGDRLTNPSIRFDVRIPQADAETQAAVANALTPESMPTQFAYLLFTNSFMPEVSGVSTNVGASASAATALGFLTNQVSKWLSNDDYNIVLRYRPATEMTSDEVDFGVSKSLINNRLMVEVEGNYIVDDRQSVNGNMSNFMGEAYITWLIDKAGNLRLRGFTQTIDRFDENQGLQETGIGIYYKEDFNNLRDLRQRIRERFTNKRRRERREAHRAAEAEAATMHEPSHTEGVEPDEAHD